jgi:WD40 repeat protein
MKCARLTLLILLVAVGNRVAISSVESSIGKERVLSGHTVDVRSVAFSPDGRSLASAGYFNADGGQRMRVSEIKLWDVATGKVSATLRGHEDGVVFVAFSPDGKALASGGYRIVLDKNDRKVINELKLWDLATGEERATFQGEPESSFSTAFAYSPDGNLLALGSEKGITLWDAAGQANLIALDSNAVKALAFSPDSKTLAGADWYEGADALGGPPVRWTVKLFQVGTRKGIASFEGTGDEGRMASLALSPDGKILAAGNAEGTVRLWDLATKRERALLKQSSVGMRNVNSLAFSADGRILATGSGDGLIKLWDAVNWRERASFKREGEWINSMAFSPNGRTLASGSSKKTIRLWDVASMLERRSDGTKRST